MNALAIVPARVGSKGIPRKNFTPLAGSEGSGLASSPTGRAVWCAVLAGIERIRISTDHAETLENRGFGPSPEYRTIWAFRRPAHLAQDDTPMIAVVQHALEQIQGPPDQIVVLLQPTQVLRTPAHVQRAIALLEETSADSVVSVVELPQTHSPDLALAIRPIGDEDIGLTPWLKEHAVGPDWGQRRTRRQAARPAYIADGTVYAFWRRTVTQYETIYGDWVVPMVMDPAETCALDTPADWAEAERRLKERKERDADRAVARG